MLNETISKPGFDIFDGFANVDFSTTPPTAHELFNITVDGTELSIIVLQFYLVGNDVEIYYYTSAEDRETVYNGRWYDDSYRTITFISEPIEFDADTLHYMSTEETLAWLAENATEITDN